MYEPRVRNRHVAPEKMDIPSNDGYSFLTSKKKRKGRKTEREREKKAEIEGYEDKKRRNSKRIFVRGCLPIVCRTCS